MDILEMDSDNSDTASFPMVSICLLTYQHAKYIADCMEGVLSQTYPSIELIVLDDASVDDTAKIINSFENELKKRNFKFHFIRHKMNRGNIPANLNEMLMQSHGKYIKMLSGDDILLKDCVFSLVKFLEGRNCSIAYSNAYLINDEYKYGEWFGREKLLKNHHEIRKDCLFKKLLKENCIPSPTAMIQRNIYEKYGFYDESIGYEDYELWLRLAGKEEFAYLDQCLYLYRKSETGLSNCNSNSKFIFMYNQTVKTLKKYIVKIPKHQRERFVVDFYKDWIERAKKERYWSIYLRINFKLIRWILKTKRKNSRLDFLILYGDRR